MKGRILAVLLILFLVLLPGSSSLADGSGPANVAVVPGPGGPPVPAAISGDSAAGGCGCQIAGSGWITGSVDISKTFLYMRDNSLALDGAGHPHVAYGGDHLYYAYHDGATWYIETVDEGLQVGVHASLQLDAAGRPHIAYYDQANDDLKYACHDGTAWQIQVVDPDDGMS